MYIHRHGERDLFFCMMIQFLFAFFNFCRAIRFVFWRRDHPFLGGGRSIKDIKLLAIFFPFFFSCENIRTQNIQFVFSVGFIFHSQLKTKFDADFLSNTVLIRQLLTFPSSNFFIQPKFLIVCPLKGGDGLENVSVVKSQVMEGFSLRGTLGGPREAAEKLLSTFIAPPDSGTCYHCWQRTLSNIRIPAFH